MPRLGTKRSSNWGTGDGKNLERQKRADDWRRKRNARKRVVISMFLCCFLPLMFSCMAVPRSPDTVYRNIHWNNAIQNHKAVNDGLHDASPYMMRNEKIVNPQTIDAKAIGGINKAIQNSKNLTQNLKKLKAEIEQNGTQTEYY